MSKLIQKNEKKIRHLEDTETKVHLEIHITHTRIHIHISFFEGTDIQMYRFSSLTPTETSCNNLLYFMAVVPILCFVL